MEPYGASDSLGLFEHDIPKFLLCELDLLWEPLWLLDLAVILCCFLSNQEWE